MIPNRPLDPYSDNANDYDTYSDAANNMTPKPTPKKSMTQVEKM